MLRPLLIGLVLIATIWSGAPAAAAPLPVALAIKGMFAEPAPLVELVRYRGTFFRPTPRMMPRPPVMRPQMVRPQLPRVRVPSVLGQSPALRRLPVVRLPGARSPTTSRRATRARSLPRPGAVGMAARISRTGLIGRSGATARSARVGQGIRTIRRYDARGTHGHRVGTGRTAIGSPQRITTRGVRKFARAANGNRVSKNRAGIRRVNADRTRGGQPPPKAFQVAAMGKGVLVGRSAQRREGANVRGATGLSGKRALMLAKLARSAVRQLALLITAKKASAANLNKPVAGGNPSEKLWATTKTHSSARNALAHWNKHRRDFPQFRNAREYASAAKAFLHKPPASAYTKVRANGDVLRYHPKSNTFAVMNKSGFPKTMFKPEAGIEYWRRQ